MSERKPPSHPDELQRWLTPALTRMRLWATMALALFVVVMGAQLLAGGLVPSTRASTPRAEEVGLRKRDQREPLAALPPSR